MNLVLFFTRGASLTMWNNVGMFEREVAVYRRLRDLGHKVAFITYGDKRELAFGERLPGIRICCNRWNLSPKVYERLLPYLHMGALRQADLLKTNQTNGADVAMRATRRWGKPLIARCGYMWSEFAASEHGAESELGRKSLEIERQAFSAAARVVVTTQAMRESIVERLPDRASAIEVIPNYVEVDRFCPAADPSLLEEAELPLLCFVGRLAPQKNLENLFQALEGLACRLNVIGQGVLHDRLQEQAKSNPNIRLLGRVANDRLPEEYRKATAFVFPSFYEGHPKTLIEAMACGLPVIASDVLGNRELVRHGETGWLCQTDSESIRVGIREVLGDAELRARLGRNARQYIVEHFSLDQLIERELALYRQVLEEAQPKK